MASKEYTLRVITGQATGRQDQKDALRIFLPTSALTSNNIKTEDAVVLVSRDGRRSAGIAWPGKAQNDIQTSKTFQDIHGLQPSERVTIQSSGQVTDIVDVELAVVSENSDSILENASHWSWYMRQVLYKAEYLTPGMEFKINFEQNPTFRITRINPKPSIEVYRWVESSKVSISSSQDDELVSSVTGPLTLDTSHIGGLHGPLMALRRWLGRLDMYSKGTKQPGCTFLQDDGPGAMVLQGPSGSGKTMLLRCIEASQWAAVFSIIIGRTKATEIEEIFKKASSYQRCVVTIDRLEKLAEDSKGALALVEGLEATNHKPVLVFIATRSSGSIPILSDNGIYFNTVKLQNPNLADRKEIARLKSKLGRHEANEDLDHVAELANGYSAGDLVRVLHQAEDILMGRRWDESEQTQITSGVPELEQNQSTLPSAADYKSALLSIGPASMMSNYLETPKVYWNDIGGAHEAKKSIREAIDSTPDVEVEIKRIGIQSIKGLLLYGPPGCSKTLCAKAVATESAMNFLAVKGPEILDKYVGEAERKLREIFQTARAAAPAIIFFDEIDVVGARRDDGSSGASGATILTTLLNELDGIEELKDVWVLAATNRPEVLDPALIRPGRLSQHCYLGPPGLQSRREILEIKMNKMDIVDMGGKEGYQELIDKLANNLEGLSPAEIIEVCEKAGRELVWESKQPGNPPLKGRKVERRHFEQAAAQAKRTITPEVVAAYKAWGMLGEDGQ